MLCNYSDFFKFNHAFSIAFFEDYCLLAALIDSIVRAAHFFHVNFFACSSPVADNESRISLSFSNIIIFSLISDTLCVLNNSAHTPQTSGNEEEFEQATGVLHAIASSGGKPNPSYKLGKTNIVAVL